RGDLPGRWLAPVDPLELFGSVAHVSCEGGEVAVGRPAVEVSDDDDPPLGPGHGDVEQVRCPGGPGARAVVVDGAAEDEDDDVGLLALRRVDRADAVSGQGPGEPGAKLVGDGLERADDEHVIVEYPLVTMLGPASL